MLADSVRYVKRYGLSTQQSSTVYPHNVHKYFQSRVLSTRIIKVFIISLLYLLHEFSALVSIVSLIDQMPDNIMLIQCYQPSCEPIDLKGGVCAINKSMDKTKHRYHPRAEAPDVNSHGNLARNGSRSQFDSSCWVISKTRRSRPIVEIHRSRLQAVLNPPLSARGS